jgi:hypothetical protein
MKTYLKRTMMILMSVMLVMSSVGMAFADEDVSTEETNEVIEANLSNINIVYNKFRITDGVLLIKGDAYLPLTKTINLLGLQNAYDKTTNTMTITSDLNPENYRGTAELIYSNGTYYKGDFKNGQFNGDGAIVFPDGSKYEGHFVNGAISGQGEYTAVNGDRYEGQFARSDYKGYGEYTYANGDTLEATFNGGAFTGYAYVDVHGEEEEEQVKANKWKMPIETVGMNDKAFDLNKYNGTVDFIYANGDYYKGSMTDNLRNGTGTFTLQDGTEYSGNWIMGNESGYGTMRYEDGSSYKGYFKECIYNGYGKLYYANGDTYDGAWKNGDKEGYGKYTEANGDYFYGIWKNDLKHTKYEEDDEDYEGYGAYVVNKKNTSDGETVKYKQKWDEGKLIRERDDN